MIDLNGALEPMIKELRQVLSNVDGSKSVDEALHISYVVEVDSEDKKENVEKVAELLATQAEKFGFFIEVTPVTTEELEESKAKFAEYLAKNTKFKA